MYKYVYIYIYIYTYIHTHIYILVGRGPGSSTGCVRGTAQSEPREVADGKGAAYAARVALLRAQRKVAEGRRAAEDTRYRPPCWEGARRVRTKGRERALPGTS